MKTIKHQTQPTWDSCVATCIAMIIGKPATDVDKEFTEGYMSGDILTKDYLKKEGFVAVQLPSKEVIQWGKLYMLIVPSLTKRGHLHAVLFDTRNEDKDGDYYEVLLDPNKGKEGKLYYDLHKLPDGEWLKGGEFIPLTGDLGVQLCSYVPNYEIKEEDNV